MRIAVAVSGGVDSSLVAALLKKEGHEVFGIRMAFEGAGSDEEVRNICAKLDIPLHNIDYEGSFDTSVLEYAIGDHLSARTPNPCVECNKRLKFGSLLGKALELGADAMATGHFVRVERDSSGLYRLKKAVATGKDQSYFLSMLKQDALSKVIFPLGGMRDKQQVRDMAEEFGLLDMVKNESQNACFALDNDYGRVVFSDARFSDLDGGDIVDLEGNVRGRHDGFYRFTIGQRKGLNISSEERLYVCRIEPEYNRVTIGPRESLAVSKMTVGPLSLTAEKSLRAGERVTAVYRYHNPGGTATLRPLDGTEIVNGSMVEVVYDEPVYGVAPGQAAVFCRDDEVLGGAYINSTDGC